MSWCNSDRQNIFARFVTVQRHIFTKPERKCGKVDDNQRNVFDAFKSQRARHGSVFEYMRCEHIVKAISLGDLTRNA